MPFYPTSLVFGLLGAEAAGTNPKNGVLPAIFASTVRSPVMAMVWGMLVGRLGGTPNSSGYSIVGTPAASGSSSGGGTPYPPAAPPSASAGVTSAKGAPKIDHLKVVDDELQIAGENFGRIKNAVMVNFSWPAGSPHMATETMPLARHDAKLKNDLITIAMSELPEAAAHSRVVVRVTVNGVSSNSKEIDL